MRSLTSISRMMAGVSALAFIVSASGAMATATPSTYTVSSQTPDQILLNSRTLGNGTLSNLGALATGSYSYNYVTVFFTPDTSVTGATFGVYEANFDPVAILYSGTFDPLNPSTNALAGNDDNYSLVMSSGLTPIGCGGVCSAFSADLVGGQTYYLFLSTYSSGTAFTTPVSFFATGTTFHWGTFTPIPTSTDIDTSAPGGYDAGLLGSTLNAAFTGGTLYFTTGDQVFTQNFTLDNSGTNTINLSGLTTTFTGAFTDQSTNGSLSFTNTGTGGTVILAGTNTYSGTTTIEGGAQVNLTGSISNTSRVQIQSGGVLVIDNGGALTAGGVTNQQGGSLFIAQGATLTDDMDNAGQVENAGVSNAIVNTNTGTITNDATGQWNGGVRSNSGAIYNAGIWNGDVSTSGTFVNTGTLNGDLTNTGTVQASGTFNGAVTSSGTFALTGNLTGNGSAFENAGTLVIGGNDLSGFGTVSNTAGATIAIGTAAANGSLRATDLSNAGTLTMMNGHTGDVVTVAGTYMGAAGSVLSFDVDLASGKADHLNVATLSGQSLVRINNVSGKKTYLATPLVLVSSTGGAGTLTADTDAATTDALSTQSLISYDFRKITGTNDWGIVSTLNTPALSSLPGSLTAYVTAQNLTLSDLPDEVFVHDVDAGVNQWMGNSWARAYTGDLSLKDTFTISDAYSSAATTKARSSQDGTQFGFDVGVYNIQGTGASLRVGLMGGSTQAKVEDQSLRGASLKIDAPNYGFYTALTHKGLRLSGQERNEVLNTDVTNPVLGLSSRRFKARSQTVSWALSDRFDIGTVFIEPVIGYMTTKVNAGALILPDDMGRVEIASLKSQLAHAGARIGTTLTTRNVTWTPYGEVQAWQEKAPESQVAYVPEGEADAVWLGAKRAGTFGQMTAGVTAQSRSNENLSGYLSADVRTGNAMSGWTVRTGLKYRMR